MNIDFEQKEEKQERKRFEPGFYKDIPNHEYHGSAGTSSSQLKKLIEKTGAHLAHGKTQPTEHKDHFALGSAFHTLTLEPHMAEKDIVLMPSYNLRKPADREKKQQFIESHPHQAIVTAEQLNKAELMAKSVREHPVAGLLVEDCVVESSVYWWYKSTDPDENTDYSEMMKVRPDFLPRGYPIIGDLKSTRDGSMSGFAKDIVKYYYHVSAAMYKEGVNQCKELLEEMGQIAFNKFVFVVVESEEPFLCSVYELSEDDMNLGRAIFRRMANKLNQCKRDNWPGFPDEVRTIELPAWASRGWIV